MKQLALVAAPIVALASGCMLSPNWGDSPPDHTKPIDFQLFAIAPSAKMTLECTTPWWYGDPDYHQFAEVVADDKPLLTMDGGSIYNAHISKVVPESCWGTYHGTEMVTDVRPKEDGAVAAVFDDKGRDCVVHEVLSDHKNPVTAGQDCRLRYPHSNTVVEAVEIYAAK